jgi:hypothetical protein
MKILLALFIAMGIYGVFSDHLGAGAMSFVCAYLVRWGGRRMQEEEAAYYASPDNAIQPKDTTELLSSHPTEAGRATF